MLTSLPSPAYVGYFTVGVPVNRADRQGSRAREIVQRYLYAGEVIGDEVSEDLETFLVLVRVEGVGSHRDLDRQITANRDRLSSGLYASTEPRYLAAIGPSDD